MKLFGLEKVKHVVAGVRGIIKALTTISSGGYGGGGGWFSVIKEGFTGAFQQSVAIDSPRDLLAFSAVFSCVTRIASDIAKLRVKMMEKRSRGVGEELIGTEPHLAVLRKPNHYQNRMQFFLYWLICKLLYGNVYILKVRESKRGIVKELYVLDPQRVTILVTDSGDVYYQIARDDLAGLKDAVVLPASEIIHDLMNPLWHPLVGISPIYACALSATMGNKIQRNSSKFFNNMSRPSGALTAPGEIGKELAERMKADWDENFSGDKIGKLAVLGSGLKYEPMGVPAQEAQLIEQLKWTTEDVARCFGVPLYKLGGPVPPNTSIGALNQGYYSDCLQSMIEAVELCLDEGLELPTGRYTEFDIEGLVRMDPAARYETKGKAVKDGWMKPDEARVGEDLPPVDGGDQCYLQQQNYSLAALAKRDARDDPFATAGVAPKLPAAPAGEPPQDVAAALAEEFIFELKAVA